MFEAVVHRHLLERAARRSAWSVGAGLFESIFVTGLVVITAQLAARTIPPPIVEVQFIRAAVRRPAPPPAAPPPAARPTPRRAPAATPSPDVPRVKARLPGALIQPREIAAEMKPPDPNEPLEYVEEGGEGVEGGVIGGVVGAIEPEVAATGLAPRVEQFEDAPQYATSGFRKPAEVQAGCVRNAIRMPPALAGFVAEQIVVKFAVRRDGTIGAVELLTAVPDARIGDVIRNALHACRWVPGADAQGRAIALWVVMPLRFASG